MRSVEKIYNVLNKKELDYIQNLIDDNSKWVWRTTFDELNEKGEKLWYDSIYPDYNMISNYHNFVCQNGQFKIRETAINIITKNRQNTNSLHYDDADLSFVTYFNNNFQGGRLIYYDENNEKNIIEPESGLTVRINKNVMHAVEEVYEGTRFSLYTFLYYSKKDTKTFL